MYKRFILYEKVSFINFQQNKIKTSDNFLSKMNGHTSATLMIDS